MKPGDTAEQYAFLSFGCRRMPLSLRDDLWGLS